jgi:hypothetical protein
MSTYFTVIESAIRKYSPMNDNEGETFEDEGDSYRVYRVFRLKLGKEK